MDRWTLPGACRAHPVMLRPFFRTAVRTLCAADGGTRCKFNRDVIDRHLTTLGQEMKERRAGKGLEMQGTSPGMSGGYDSNVKVA